MLKEIYKTTGLYNEQDEKGFIEEFENFIWCTEPFNDGYHYDDENEEERKQFRNYLRCDNEDWWDHIKGRMEYLMEGKTYHIKGTLGLWNGLKQVKAVVDGFEAVLKCIKGANEFSIEEKKGTLKITAYHHDGVNRFTIKEKTSKGLRSPYLNDKIWEI